MPLWLLRLVIPWASEAVLIPILFGQKVSIWNAPGMTMTSRVEVRVPVRVDLAGGWTDVQPYTSDYGGEVVNFTINKYIKCSMEQDNEGKKKIEYSSDVPTGSGLGTSGAMNVGLIATIAGKK